MANSSLTGAVSPTLLNSFPGLAVWHDRDSKFITANNICTALVGYRKQEQVVGISYWDVRSKSAEMAAEFIAQDKHVLDTKQKLKMVSYILYADDRHVLLVGEKAPLRNESGEIIGVASYHLDMTSTYLSYYSELINQDKKYNKGNDNQFSYLIDNYRIKSKNLNLTRRQAECLFHLLRGKTNKRIAELLCCSPRTIENHVDNLKDIFGCYSKSQLIEFAFDQGFFNIIPETLFGQK